VILFLCSLSLAGLWAGAARGSAMQNVTGGTTSLTFTADLNALKVGVAPLGNAQLDASGDFLLPITAGKMRMHPLRGKIENDNSGIAFTFDDRVTVDLEDLVIDFNHRVVRGDLSAGPVDLTTRVFKLVPCGSGKCTGSTSSSDYGLFLRAQAADFFENDVFRGNGFDDGDQIALLRIGAASDPAVPEPTVLAGLGIGLAALVAARRRAA
jgi:hypothetical protein